MTILLASRQSRGPLHVQAETETIPPPSIETKEEAEKERFQMETKDDHSSK